MIKKIKQWWTNRKLFKGLDTDLPDFNQVRVAQYDQRQVDAAYSLGYADGKKDGIAIARQMAVKSLQEIVRQQNVK